MNIYCGNLSYGAEEQTLKELFEAHGEVVSVKIIKDRETGRSRGFAFVEMADEESGKKAVEALNGKDYDGRALKVNVAKPKRF